MFGLLVSALTLVRVEGHLEHGFPVEFGHVTGHLLDHFFKESTLVGLQVRVELRSYPLLQTFLAWNGTTVKPQPVRRDRTSIRVHTCLMWST